MKLYAQVPAKRLLTEYPDAIPGRGVEPEVGALLYALVRMIKPTVCVETGLYIGDSSEWIATALLDNKKGHLTTCDIKTGAIQQCQERFAKSGLPLTIRKERGIELLTELAPVDFAFIDSGTNETRLEELQFLTDKTVNPGGIVCYHDATSDMARVYEAIAESHDWPHLIVPSCVGLAIFQRPELFREPEPEPTEEPEEPSE